MRLFAMAALTAIGLGIVATSGAYAAPISASSIGKADSAISQLTTVRWGWGGFAAGAVAGAVIGGLAARGYAYGPGYYYYDPGYYYGPPPYVYEAPPVYVAPRSSYSGYSHGGYYYGPQDHCWPCY